MLATFRTVTSVAFLVGIAISADAAITEGGYPADTRASSVPICCQVADEKLAPCSRTTGLPSSGPATR